VRRDALVERQCRPLCAYFSDLVHRATGSPTARDETRADVHGMQPTL
jgi:hypothetical protein